MRKDACNGPGSFARLMDDVPKFEHYVAQGGDWGAIIVSWMALRRAPALAAIHLNGPAPAAGAQRPGPANPPR